MPSWAIFSIPGNGAFRVFLVIEGYNFDIVGRIADLDSTRFVNPCARVCMERTFEMPQAAAGPLVTPTKPILSTWFAAKPVELIKAEQASIAIIETALSNVFLCILFS